ncbi:MAG: chemotaxis protein CheX [Rubrobacteridae bacterium]|nr:chemotaxis protein CheX [Rubrobacteridae bacterium]
MTKQVLANPFVSAANDMLGLELGFQVTQGNPIETTSQGTSQELNILVGVTGVVSGTVIFGMSLSTAKAIASTMLAKPIESLDRNAQSAICELGNMVCGMAVSKFDAEHSDVALTPPSLIVGKDIFISILKIGCVHTSLSTEVGNLDVTVALEEHVIRQAQAV